MKRRERIIIDNVSLVIYNNEPVVSSREIADRFEKQHRNVTRDIENIIVDLGSAQNCAHLFIQSKYTNEQNKQTYREYLLTRDGFSLLAMGFTGSKALHWKLKYIEAFNKMEQAMKQSISSKDAAILAIVNANGDIQRSLAITNYEKLVTQPLIEALEEQKPLVEFASRVTDTTDSIDIGEMAKLLHDKNNINIGRNKLFELLRRIISLIRNT